MKNAVLVALAVVAVAAGLRLWKATSTLAEDPAGVLAAKLEGRLAPGGKLLLVVADAGAGADLLRAPGPWLSRLSAVQDGEGPLLAKMMSAQEPDAVSWMLGPGRLAREGEVVRELSEAFTRAKEAGAQVDVLVQGSAAAPVLKAVAGLAGKADVRRLVVLGTNLDGLKAADPAFFGSFSRPGNLKEWSNLWGDGKHPPHVELFYKGRSGSRYPAFPRDEEATSAEPETVLRLVLELLGSDSAMEDILEKAAEPEEAEGGTVKAGEAAVTCGQYKRCVMAAACEPEPCGGLGDGDAPCMYRDEKGAYCKWLRGSRAWANVSSKCRAAFRGGVRPQLRFDQSFGFRCGDS
jgi:hypothetical protein